MQILKNLMIEWRCCKHFCWILVCFLLVFVDPLSGAQCRAQATTSTSQIGLQDSTRTSESRKKEKSPKGAFFRSVVIPGWGQWYNDKKIKAVLAFSAESFLIGLSIYYNNRAAESEPGSNNEAVYKDKRNQTYWFILGLALVSGVDAYIDAHLYDFDTGPDLSVRFGPIRAADSALHTRAFGLSLKAEF